MQFQADSYIDFIHAQADVLHAHTTQPVGTDMMPINGISHQHMNDGLDVVQFNHYNTPENLWETTFWMEYLRPLKQRPFWNTETATCWNGSTAANGYREPGFCRANSWIPIALGGEANLYWLWRAHWSGHELMHGSVVSSSGRPLHIIGEVREVSAGFRAAAGFLNDTRPAPTGLALHFSEFAWWLYEFQPMVNGFRYNRRLLDAYRALRDAHLRVDVIDPAVSLDNYRVLFSPYLPALDEADLCERLHEWIEKGGIWIAGPLTDIRTLDATKYTHAPFGSLEEWTGVYCPFEIPADPREFNMRWNDGRTGSGSVWYSAFEPRGADVLATYTEGPMQRMAAVTHTQVGQGQIILLGSMPQPTDLSQLLLTVCESADIHPVTDASSNLLVAPRNGQSGSGLVVVEMENRPATLTLPGRMTDLITNQPYEGRLDVPPYGVMVLKSV
jgi:beta-galactosidase GanA